MAQPLAHRLPVPFIFSWQCSGTRSVKDWPDLPKENMKEQEPALCVHHFHEASSLCLYLFMAS